MKDIRGRGGGHYKMLVPRETCGGRLRGRRIRPAYETPRRARGCILKRASARDHAPPEASGQIHFPHRVGRSANVKMIAGLQDYIRRCRDERVVALDRQ